MIVNKKNKGFQTRSDANNFNWLKSDEWYVVADNTPLANKIMQLFPRYDFVLDENDNLIDVVEIPKTDEEIKQERIEEIKTELSSLDTTVDRQWEDYYKRENITPVDRIAVVIAKKEELREELKTLTKVGE
jgi:predicted nuclease with TOPRIM domain